MSLFCNKHFTIIHKICGAFNNIFGFLSGSLTLIFSLSISTNVPVL